MPQLQRLGGSRLLIPPQLSSVSEDASQTAARRNRGIEQLVQAYPEFAPSSGLLPSLAEESEAIQKSTSDYDPAVSDVLAVGRAYHPLHHRRNANTTSVLALPGGAAGELVRVIQLVPDIIGWEEEPNIKLQDDRFHSRIQGLWYGNGSRIQQLQFAKLNGEPTEWLAVRYGGITSILRIILREGEVPTLYNIPHHPAIEADVELRLKLEHIATLSLQRSGGIPHADVCFNPRNSWQFAIVDQSSQWSTWSIRSINKKIGTWTVEAGKLGDIAEDLSDDTELVTGRKRQLDGWGAVRWVGDGCLLICNRTRITCHKLSNPPSQLPMPGLGLRKTKSRILDVREAPNNPEHLFVVTSSRIFWIHLTLEHTEMEDQPRLKVEILLTWVHFRNELDASLSVQVVELGLGKLPFPLSDTLQWLTSR